MVGEACIYVRAYNFDFSRIHQASHLAQLLFRLWRHRMLPFYERYLVDDYIQIEVKHELTARAAPVISLVSGEGLMVWIPLHDDVRSPKR